MYSANINSCIKCMDSQSIIHDRTPDRDDLSTDRSFDSQATWVIDVLCIFVDMLSMTSGRLVHKLNVCTVPLPFISNCTCLLCRDMKQISFVSKSDLLVYAHKGGLSLTSIFSVKLFLSIPTISIPFCRNARSMKYLSFSHVSHYICVAMIIKYKI